MKQELQDKLDRAVALRDDAFHECLDAIREVLKANDGFLDLHREGRATIRARVWDDHENNYVDADVHAARLNGKDIHGEEIVELFVRTNTRGYVPRKNMELTKNADYWHPVSADDESIYPMDPVFELVYLIDEFVEDESSENPAPENYTPSQKLTRKNLYYGPENEKTHPLRGAHLERYRDRTRKRLHRQHPCHQHGGDKADRRAWHENQGRNSPL